MTITVPVAAQQVILFMAPATGGDFKTLVSAVRGRPGAFVRTSQDLNQAALDRSRLERYIATIRSLNDVDPMKLSTAAPLLARSLAIRVDDKCLEKIPELQAPCLMTGQEALILNDGHSTSMVEALTSGPGSDLAMEASYTPQLSYGYYSPYIASVLDIARIMDSFHTAQYQYIPALASHEGSRMLLTLNTAPSFHNPKSVLVAALPAVEEAQFPPMHAVNPKEIYCASKTSLVLPVEGAPLVFATAYAHQMLLTVSGGGGATLDLPVRPDALQGGYVVDTSGLQQASLGNTVRASLHGQWGFEPFDGPSFSLMNAHTQAWALAPGDEQSLIIGRQDTVHVRAASVNCVDGIMLKDPSGKELKTEWKTVRPDEIEIKLPLQGAAPGGMTLLVKQYGSEQVRDIPIVAFSEAGRFDGFSLHVGDTAGVLKGSRLDEVVSLVIKNVTFLPGELSSKQGNDELPMLAQDSQTVAALKAEHTVPARVALRDGRSFPVTALVLPPRPAALLINKSVQPSSSQDESHLHMPDQSELPQDARLTFSVRARMPATFSRDQSVEVATLDETVSALLTVANGGITLENAEVAVATFNPAKSLGPSAFGPLQFRVTLKGVAGDWQPLITLVRLPRLHGLTCALSPELTCRLSGASLFLIDSLSGDDAFTHAVRVPDGFVGAALAVPHPASGPLYLKLRDDPTIIHAVTLEVQQATPAVEDVAHQAAP